MNALKQLNASQQEPLNDFKAYLEQSLRNPFTLNLKDCSLVEVILACAKARSKLHKSYHKTISGLLYNIRLLEAEYRRCDLYYNYVRLFLEDPDRLLEEIQRRKDLISQGIVHILSTQKLQQKTCRSCKRRLPWNWPYKVCDTCYRRHTFK